MKQQPVVANRVQKGAAATVPDVVTGNGDVNVKQALQEARGSQKMEVNASPLIKSVVQVAVDASGRSRAVCIRHNHSTDEAAPCC